LLSDEYGYRILKLLEADPQTSQRRLAQELGVSLGRANYCLQALVDKGLVKVANFRSSKDRRAYLYVLTPRGIEAKAKITLRFLKTKALEYENLARELDELRREAESLKRQRPAGAAK
jgi:EPS-associated MarR family transcriptional regulator